MSIGNNNMSCIVENLFTATLNNNNTIYWTLVLKAFSEHGCGNDSWLLSYILPDYIVLFFLSLSNNESICTPWSDWGCLCSFPKSPLVWSRPTEAGVRKSAKCKTMLVLSRVSSMLKEREPGTEKALNASLYLTSITSITPTPTQRWYSAEVTKVSNIVPLGQIKVKYLRNTSDSYRLLPV